MQNTGMSAKSANLIILYTITKALKFGNKQ